MDIERRGPKTRTDVKSLIDTMVQNYHSNMRKSRSHIVLAPLTEESGGPKGGKITWTDELEQVFNYLKEMFSAETLLNYPDWTILFTTHTDASDNKQLGPVISQNDKPITFVSR